MMALVKAMRVRVYVVYLDAHGTGISFYDFKPFPHDDPEWPTKEKQEVQSQLADVWLLYRPGHYDILYPSTLNHQP